jgi:thiamine-monophosphate kinase
MAKNPLDWVLHGGEDYVILAAINPNSLETLSELFRSKGLTLVPIGEFVPGSTMVLRRIDGSSVVVTSGGWDHFR